MPMSLQGGHEDRQQRFEALNILSDSMRQGCFGARQRHARRRTATATGRQEDLSLGREAGQRAGRQCFASGSGSGSDSGRVGPGAGRPGSVNSSRTESGALVSVCRQVQ